MKCLDDLGFDEARRRTARFFARYCVVVKASRQKEKSFRLLYLPLSQLCGLRDSALAGGSNAKATHKSRPSQMEKEQSDSASLGLRGFCVGRIIVAVGLRAPQV